ncbi:hypothetical protein ACLB2K_022949 [Fragaria x ananassa]
MAKKKPSNKKIKVKKCPHCNYCTKPADLAAHIKFKHENRNAGLMTEVDKHGKAKVFYCAGCTPLPREFSSQSALDEYKIRKNN